MGREVLADAKTNYGRHWLTCDVLVKTRGRGEVEEGRGAEIQELVVREVDRVRVACVSCSSFTGPVAGDVIREGLEGVDVARECEQVPVPIEVAGAEGGAEVHAGDLRCKESMSSETWWSKYLRPMLFRSCGRRRVHRPNAR